MIFGMHVFAGEDFQGALVSRAVSNPRWKINEDGGIVQILQQVDRVDCKRCGTCTMMGDGIVTLPQGGERVEYLSGPAI